MYLSIDVGIKNLGYAIYDADFNDLEFGMFNIEANINKKNEVVIERCRVIRDFFKMLNVEAFDGVIIERQVNKNITAMGLMYAIANEALNYTSNVIIFAPLLKFKTFGIKYSTKGKEHKKLSVNIALNLLQTHFPKLIDEFRVYKKKDDISDALNQLFTVLFQEKITEIRLK